MPTQESNKTNEIGLTFRMTAILEMQVEAHDCSAQNAFDAGANCESN